MPLDLKVKAQGETLGILETRDGLAYLLLRFAAYLQIYSFI